MYPRKQTFFVRGLSKSGKAATEFLLSHGAITYVYDDSVSERVEQVAQAVVLEVSGLSRTAFSRTIRVRLTHYMVLENT